MRILLIIHVVILKSSCFYLLKLFHCGTFDLWESGSPSNCSHKALAKALWEQLLGLGERVV